MEDDERMTSLGFLLLFPQVDCSDMTLTSIRSERNESSLLQIAGSIFAIMGRRASDEGDVSYLLSLSDYRKLEIPYFNHSLNTS